MKEKRKKSITDVWHWTCFNDHVPTSCEKLLHCAGMFWILTVVHIFLKRFSFQNWHDIFPCRDLCDLNWNLSKNKLAWHIIALETWCFDDKYGLSLSINVESFLVAFGCFGKKLKKPKIADPFGKHDVITTWYKVILCYVPKENMFGGTFYPRSIIVIAWNSQSYKG